VLAVGQLDQHDAQIARHGHQHLAEVFGLRLLIGGELHLVELGQAIDQLGDFLAEFFGQLVLGGPVSSSTSCSSAAQMASASIRHSTTAPATASGWVM
jgi:hypothetical protein